MKEITNNKKVEIKKDKQPAEPINGYLLAKDLKFYIQKHCTETP